MTVDEAGPPTTPGRRAGGGATEGTETPAPSRGPVPNRRLARMTARDASNPESPPPTPPGRTTTGAARPSRPDMNRPGLIATACALGILTGIAFAPALAADFVFLDDPV